tara:strand:- start:1567 stop:1953 length:387 start_codon:yes stop_codon:yes gene_type:complete
MKTKQQIFALAQILPYFKDTNTCGMDESGSCQYITKEGKMCVAGKNMLNPSKFGNVNIDDILNDYTQKEIFKPNAVDMLNGKQWFLLQKMHDCLSTGKQMSLKIFEEFIDELNMFTYNELVEESRITK